MQNPIIKVIDGKEVFVHRCAVCNVYKPVEKNFKFKDGILSNRCNTCVEKKNKAYTDDGWRWSSDVIDFKSNTPFSGDPNRYLAGDFEDNWND